MSQITAQLLVNAVKNAAINPVDIYPGDFIVITQEHGDTVGIVDSVQKTANDGIEMSLHTSRGLQKMGVSAQNYIHLIKEAQVLDLRKHNDYERDLKDMSDNQHGYEDGYTERPQFSPEDIEKSNIPAAKISLNLRRVKDS